MVEKGGSGEVWIGEGGGALGLESVSWAGFLEVHQQGMTSVL
jgi:hypothetical protein